MFWRVLALSMMAVLYSCSPERSDLRSIEGKAKQPEDSKESGTNLQFVNLVTGPLKKMLSAAYHQTCMIREGGSSVNCYGDNRYGQAVDQRDLVNPSYVSVGARHACAIHDGGIRCWGDDSYGKTDMSGFASANQVVAGFQHTCVRSQERVSCVGRNLNGILQVPAGLRAQEIAGGNNFMCARSRYTANLICWGEGSEGKTNPPPMEDSYHGYADAPTLLAGPNNACVDDGRTKCWGSNRFGVNEVPSQVVKIRSVGATQACGQDINGNLICWGAGSRGDHSLTPHLLRDVEVAELAIGANHGCVRSKAGENFCWGRNDFGQASLPLDLADRFAVGPNASCEKKDDASWRCVGDNQFGQLNFPPEAIVSLSLGVSHSCYIDREGLKCIGQNAYGKLNVPEAAKKAFSVSVGYHHSCALTDDNVLCWGNNNRGQTRVPNFIGRPRAVKVARNHSCAIDDEGVKCWGENSYGQAGNFLGENITDLSVGEYHNCAISNQEIHCWGRNSHSQLSPHTEKGPALSVASGALFTCASFRDDIACWGDRSFAQDKVIRAQRRGGKIYAGRYHACYPNGFEEICWGRDHVGQLLNRGDLELTAQFRLNMYEDLNGELGNKIVDHTLRRGQSYFVEIEGQDLRPELSFVTMNTRGVYAGILGAAFDLVWTKGATISLDDPFDVLQSDRLMPACWPAWRLGELHQEDAYIKDLQGTVGSLNLAPNNSLGNYGVGPERISLLRFKVEQNASTAGFKIHLERGQRGITVWPNVFDRSEHRYVFQDLKVYIK